ncbi:MAG TPA: YibE/F family protein, partial [Atribacteraceae bacterium]|nr:YibE/F family protein [Atribacteraceae bacterium]
ILVVGKWKGIKTIITLGLTALVLFWVILPLLLRGYEPIPVTVFGAVVIIVFDFLIIGGLNTKSLAAIVGTTSGIAVAGTLALWAGNSANLTGFSSQEAQMLFFADPPINIRGLLFAGIIIGSLGAITDVGMSVASAASEVKKTDPSIDPLRLIRSAMNVGRDIMGTMANTLLLAYVGGATPLLLLLMSQGGGTTWTKILNLDLVATEFVRGLTGSIGLVLSIPVTAVVAGFLMSRSRHPSPGTQRGRNRANNFFRHKKTGSPF